MNHASEKIAWIGRLAAATVIAVMILGGVGLFGIYAQHRETARTVASYEHRRLLEGALLDALVAFKLEIQEWKNVLLRGQTIAEFDVWKSVYLTRTQETAKTFDTLTALTEKREAPDEGKRLIEQLKAQHAAHVAFSLDALTQHYRQNDPDSIFTVDRLVRGKDREIAKELDAYAKREGDLEIAALEASIKDGEARYQSYRSVTMTIVAITGCLALAMALLSTHVGRSLLSESSARNG